MKEYRNQPIGWGYSGASSSRRPSLPIHQSSVGSQVPKCSYDPNHVDIALRAKMHGCRIEPMVSKPSHLSLDGPTGVQLPRITDSTRSLQIILRYYLKLKSEQTGSGRGQQEFVTCLHSTVCEVRMCDCKRYRGLLKHFDSCPYYPDCKLCLPVRDITNLGSERPNRYRDPHARDDNFQDMQSIPKRMKMGNVAQSDDGSLYAVISQNLKQSVGVVNNEDAIGKTNKEPFGSIEALKTTVTWSATADNVGGSIWIRISDGFSRLGQSNEGHISSASLNQSPGNLGNSLQTVGETFDLFNQKLGTNGVIYHVQDLSAHEHQEMGRVETSNAKSTIQLMNNRTWAVDNDGGSMWSRKPDELSGFGQSSEGHMNSGAMNEVFESIGNTGNSLQTDGSGSDLFNINTGIDDAIFHAEEYNSVDGQQDMDCETSNAKNDVTFCYPSSNSERICVLPQVDGHQTSSDALDLDNINLGKDCTMSLSEEHNLVGEQHEIGCAETGKEKTDATFSCQSLNPDGISGHPQEPPIDEEENFKLTSEAKHDKVDANDDFPNPNNHCGRNLDDLKASGVTLTDFFTADQIREHLRSLNKDILETSTTVGSDTCQLCLEDNIVFTVLDRYCSSCETRIRHKLTYYWTKGRAGARYFFCTTCFKNARGGNISCRELSFSKQQLSKDKNTEESYEAWVQCDKCKKWQHHICALYNPKRDLKGKAKYTCPFCRLEEIEVKGHVSLTPASGAINLPRTKLSDHIEHRLFERLQQERTQRAELQRKKPEEVPGVSDLKVRVVSAVNKQVRVNQQFLDILHNETYPTEFPYKSKAILLFQEVDGVDVCLFAMYVQEFGSECRKPNNRSVYISYLDSVKYFTPEIKTAAGVALRTFVYHEILIGYLDYCKQLGFVNCYIWSCPPSKGEDYILHSHPDTQKRANPDKLVKWYKNLLRKAEKENVVVGYSNFYDYFFIPNGYFKITAARLPYFDGDYWSRTIEEIAQSFEDNCGKSDKELKNQMTKRSMKAMGHIDLSIDAKKDILAMQQLRQKMLHFKDEFIIIHLQLTCTNCREPILSGTQWSCNQTQCSKFHLCGRCRELEQSTNTLKTHSDIHGEKHILYETPVHEVAGDTDDKDGLLDIDLFNDRQTFLNLCEKNSWRFDTLRRAKHSSMMILHDLHASMGTAICSICYQSAVEGWHCETCSEFHACDACYQRAGEGCHVHQLAMKADSINKFEQDTQQQEASEIEKLLEHASRCSSSRDNPCTYPGCLSLKKTFRHSKECKLRLSGGCQRCKRIWSMLMMHADNCRASDCTIPRCIDIRDHNRRRLPKNREQRGGLSNAIVNSDNRHS